MFADSFNVTIDLLITQEWTQITKSIANQVVKILLLQGLSNLTILFIPIVITLNQELFICHVGYLFIKQSR